MSEIPMRPNSADYPKLPDLRSFQQVQDLAIHEHAVAKRAVEALRRIANADHEEDGGPECDHPDVADAALRDIDASGWQP
jgi:hypothetical protein